MCRFLMVRSDTAFQPEPILTEFARMAEACSAPDGDRQADGWGIAWLEDRNLWRSRTSTSPIWDESHIFHAIPAGTAFAIHARSASFPGQNNNLQYNQPYVAAEQAFVFNGLLRGVSIPYRVDGRIGSQKLWSLLKRFTDEQGPREGIQKLAQVLECHTEHIQAMNLGLFCGRRIYAYCRYSDFPEYYQMQVHQSASLTLICSESLDGFSFRPLPTHAVLEF